LRPCSAQLMAGVNDQPLTVGDQQRRGMIFGDEMRAEANGQQSVSHRHHNELWLTAASIRDIVVLLDGGWSFSIS